MLSYCSGLAGVFTTLRMMNESSLIELDFSEIESAYSDSMLQWMNYCFSNQNYDFLHGALGVGMYFKNDSLFIKAALQSLEKTAVKDGDKLKWISSLGQDRPYGYNICLSHGMSSIVIYLCRVLQSGIMTELNEQLLDSAVKYILSQEIDPVQYGCYFPSQSLENGDPIAKSRLAWCYGDLGVAAALWQAGKATGNDVWSRKALDVFRFSANRTDLRDTMTHDAGLCHGTASIAMMFAYIYNQTSDEVFKNTRDYWLSQTFEMSRFSDGPAGYKQYLTRDNGWRDSYALLEGVSGIGLMLLSILDANAEKDMLSSFALY